MTLSERPMSSSERVNLPESTLLPSAEEQLSQPVSPMWDPLLTQQLRVLLHTDRLLSLQHRDDHRSPEYQHYSSLSLALKIFDLIITHTGLGQDIEYHQAVNELLPLLEAMDRAAGVPPDRERQVRMAGRVLATLLNEDDSRQPFKLTYTTFEQGNAIKRVLTVKLLEERYHVDGRIVLRLSHESANLLLNALTTDLEDAQAAAEAIIQSQLARGRPLALEVVGTSNIALIFENAAAFRTASQVLKRYACPPYGMLGFGAGRGFERSVLHFQFIERPIVRGNTSTKIYVKLFFKRLKR